MDMEENPSGGESGAEQVDVPTPVDVDMAVLLLGAGVTAVTHPLPYVKLLIQVGHEPLPPTVGTTLFGRRVLYLPGFFSYAHHIVTVDGKWGLFRGLSPRIVSSAISTVLRNKVKQSTFAANQRAMPNIYNSHAFCTATSKMSHGVKAKTFCPFAFFILPLYLLSIQQMEFLSQKDKEQTTLTKVVKETSHEMIIQCLSRVATHPFHVISVRCMAQFVGREIKYSGMLSCMVKIYKEEGVTGLYVGLIPHVFGEVLFLWCCNLLAHFINTYAVDESFTQASAMRSYTKFVMGIAVGALTYPFMLVADLMAVNNCGLAAGLPPHSLIFSSWIHCWTHLSNKGSLFRGSSFFFRRMPVTSLPLSEG